MVYYIEVPFCAKEDGPDHYHIEDCEMIVTKNMAALRISERLFNRITRAFRENGQPHLVRELIDPADGRTLGTLLMEPRVEDASDVHDTDSEGRGRMLTAPSGVIRDAHLEIELAGKTERAFDDIVRNAEVRTGPVPGRPGLKQASLTVTFQATDPPGAVGQLIWDVLNSDQPARFKVRDQNRSAGYAGEMLLARVRNMLVYDTPRPIYPPITFLVNGEVQEL